MTHDIVHLDFPRTHTKITDTYVTVLIPRHQLPELRAFLHALELGLPDVHMQPAGHG